MVLTKSEFTASLQNEVRIRLHLASMVTLALCSWAAYRTQLFLYLKACGRDDLGTMNLWAGIDTPAAG